MTTLTSYNPSTGEAVGSVPVTPVADIASLVERSRAAQPAWNALGIKGRGEALMAFSRAVLEDLDRLTELLVKEMGKPVASARGEIKFCATSVDKELAEVASAIEPTVLEDKRTRSTIYRDPFGVCAAIAPWNFPFAMPHSMVFPALATGNTVVLKPSEETPLIAQAYVDLMQKHLPKDVLLVVHGADEQGKALVNADVDFIAFTGSREAGKHILAAAASDLKRVVLELGGKDPLVVLESADLDKAAKFAANNSFRNAGQVCVSTERIFVPKSVAAEFTDKLVAYSQAQKVGDGFADDTSVGPMVSTRQRDHVLQQIDEAVSKGATVAHGGTGHHDNFVMPTVLTGVTPDMAIASSETFGPVACVIAVPDEDAAIAQANDTPFGLGAVVFGETEAAAAAARKLTAGMIGINKSCGGASGTPWVGARESGYGFHSGVEGHRQFTQTRVISAPK